MRGRTCVRLWPWPGATRQDSAAPVKPDQDRQDASSPDPERITLPAGSVISVRLADSVDSSHGHIGDLLTGTVDPSVLMGDQVVIPRGTEAHMRMVEDKKGHHLHGKAEVELELVSLVIDGKRLFVESDSYKKEKGAVAAKAGAAAKPAANAAAGAAADVALATNPGGALATPAIAVFHAAKVNLKPGTRVPFNLIQPFTFEKPSNTRPAGDN